MRIARLAPEDAQAVRAVRLEGLRNHPENFGTDHDEEASQPIAWWRARLSRPGGAGFGAWDGSGGLAGIISFSQEAQKKHRHLGSIGGFYVCPSYRGKGVGDALMRAALDAAKQHVEHVMLTVTSSNLGAIRLYARHGFTVVGRMPASIRVDGVDHDELQMWRKA
ncbi:MAG: GNAT family N-acetyltransferase [Rhizomicrobium sp.]